EMEQRVLVRSVPCVQLGGMRVEQRFQFVDVAFSRGVEELAVDGERIDVRLERAPAGKSVLLCKSELRVGELRIATGLAQLGESMFGLLAQPFEVGRMRQRRRRARRLVGLF